MAAPEPSVRIAGIPVQIPLSGILGVVLLAYLWAPAFARPGAQSAWATAAAFAVLLSVATLIHEFAHALTARTLGYPVQKVVLHFLGGMTLFERPRTSPLREAAIAAAGPAATFAVAGVSYVVEGFATPGSLVATLAAAMTWANMVIGIYNSLPGLPLDGGNVLKCLVWAASGSERRGTVVAAWTGRVLAAATILIPLWLIGAQVIQADLLLVVVCGVLAAMLWNGATTQLRAAVFRDRASGLSAGALARRAIPVDRDLPLAEALRRATMAGAGALVVVDARGVPIGLGQHDAIDAVPPARRPWVTVGAVARPLDAAGTVRRDLAGTDLISAVAASGREELLVTDADGLVFGVLVVSDVNAALSAR